MPRCPPEMPRPEHRSPSPFRKLRTIWLHLHCEYHQNYPHPQCGIQSDLHVYTSMAPCKNRVIWGLEERHSALHSPQYKEGFDSKERVGEEASLMPSLLYNFCLLLRIKLTPFYHSWKWPRAVVSIPLAWWLQCICLPKEGKELLKMGGRANVWGGVKGWKWAEKNIGWISGNLFWAWDL